MGQLISKQHRERIARGSVLVYLRKSREDSDQKEETLDSHRIMLEELCKKNNFTFTVKEEIGSSDTIEFRPVFKSILEEDIPSGAYTALLVHDQDRISRNVADFARVKELLSIHNIFVIDRSEQVYDYTNADDDLVSDFKSIMAKQEFQFIKRRLREGKISKAKRGYWVNGTAPYGYSYNRETKRLQPNDDSKHVKWMYEQYNEGTGLNEITFTLNRRGILSPSGKYWNNVAINRILKNEVYLGKTIYGKSSGSGHKNKKTAPIQTKDRDDWIIVENAHPSIIDESIFNSVQQHLRRRKLGTKTRKAKTSKLTGLVRCGKCGAGLQIQRRSSGNLIKPCWRIDPFGVKCGNKGIAESAVVKHLLEDIHKQQKELSIDSKKNESKDRLQEEIIRLNKELSNEESKLDKIADFLEDGTYSKEEYLRRKDKIINKQKDFKAELNILERKLSLQDDNKLKLLTGFIENINEQVSEGNINKMLRSIVENVELTRDGNGTFYIVNYI